MYFTLPQVVFITMLIVAINNVGCCCKRPQPTDKELAFGLLVVLLVAAPVAYYFYAPATYPLTQARANLYEQVRVEAAEKYRQAQADADKRIGHFITSGGSLRDTFTPAELKALGVRNGQGRGE